MESFYLITEEVLQAVFKARKQSEGRWDVFLLEPLLNWMLRQWEVLSCVEMKSPCPHPCSSSLELLVPLAIGQGKWPESPTAPWPATPGPETLELSWQL